MRRVIAFSQQFRKNTRKIRAEYEFISDILDVDWYLRSNPDIDQEVKIGKTTALKHYVEHGTNEGRRPNILFDFEYFSTKHKIPVSMRLHPRRVIESYIGISNRKLAQTHPLFDPVWYLRQNNDVEAHYALNETFPLKHYLRFGALEGRQPNPLFDPNWYLESYPEARLTCTEHKISPLEHYVNYGSKNFYSPSIDFDAGWYLQKHPDVKKLVVSGLTDALSHFIAYGRAEGRSIRAHSKRKHRQPMMQGAGHGNSRPPAIVKTEPPSNSELWTLSDRPLVSVIIVNHNGEHHLHDLVQSLYQQTYKNFEVVFVDNASTDGSCSIIRKSSLKNKIIASERNNGFAGANNIGVKNSTGELLAILNNDTRVDANWLEAMVNLLLQDSSIGAVTPKIRFWSKFVRITLRSASAFTLSRKDLLASLGYKKLFVRVGHERDEVISCFESSTDFHLVLDVPIQDDAITLNVSSSVHNQSIKLEYGLLSKNYLSERFSAEIALFFDEKITDRAMYIINNAGSLEQLNCTTADRGFGEYDSGQYDNPEQVDLICGCAALIRRDALLGYDLFQDDFVAYFEDSELSKRLRRSGFRIMYSPLSVVYHKHSATSIEKSEFWMTYVNRNQALYQYMFDSEDVRDQNLLDKMHTFQHHLNYFQDRANVKEANDANYAASLSKIIHDLPIICNKIKEGKLPSKSSIRVGLFNNFWRTLGGGEAHALSLLNTLASMGQVELISASDFDLDLTLAYFGVRAEGVRKRIVKDLSPGITGEYDIFINSTYMNECPSLAKHSFYLVSFPSKTPSAAFLSSYLFLANSRYTMNWMEEYWGPGRFMSSILTPAVSEKLVDQRELQIGEKQKIILSVGRFFRSGHSKNQHIVAQIFKNFIAQPNCHGWKLVLAGSSNDSEYVEEIRSILHGVDAEIYVNISIEELSQIYRSSYIYVHASGFGRDVNSEPENFEHFGMTVVEAALNGCVPLVYDAAGPKEIVETIGAGYCYKTVDEAVRFLTREASKSSSATERLKRSIDICNSTRNEFSITQSKEHRERLNGIFNEAMAIVKHPAST